jgi:hypothetical protein
MSQLQLIFLRSEELMNTQYWQLPLGWRVDLTALGVANEPQEWPQVFFFFPLTSLLTVAMNLKDKNIIPLIPVLL